MEKSIYSKNTIEFVTVGVEYCSFIERANELTYSELVDTSLKLLPLLYLKATLLPPPQEAFGGRVEAFVTEQEYEYTRQGIEQVLGSSDNYLEVCHEDMQYSETPIAASISELLADIYQDIKNFVSVYSFGVDEAMSDALTLCTENFATYWGQSLTNALRALHAVRYAADFEERAGEEGEAYWDKNSESEAWYD